MPIDVITVRGTGEPYGGATNMLTHVTSLLDSTKYRVLGDVSYPASVAVANPAASPVGASEEESVREGVPNLANLIRSTGNLVGVLGYSLGAEVVSRFLEAQADGQYGDCELAFTACVANPLRREGDSITADAAGYGINGQLTATPAHPHFECANPADVITSCPADSPLRGLADVVNAFGFAEIGGWTQDLVDRLLRQRWQPTNFGSVLHPVKSWELYTQAAIDVCGYPYQHTAVYVTGGYTQALADRLNAL